MKNITHYYDDVKHDTINCVPLFPVLNLWCEFEAHLTTKSFRSRDQSVRSRCSSHSAAQSHVAYSVQCALLIYYSLKMYGTCNYMLIKWRGGRRDKSTSETHFILKVKWHIGCHYLIHCTLSFICNFSTCVM